MKEADRKAAFAKEEADQAAARAKKEAKDAAAEYSEERSLLAMAVTSLATMRKTREAVLAGLDLASPELQDVLAAVDQKIGDMERQVHAFEQLLASCLPRGADAIE